MPRILDGYWCAGVGGGIASVGKLPDVTPRAQWQNAGGSCFLNDRGDVIFQNGAHLERFNVLNGEYQQDFDAQGCFSLAAGGGVYAANFYDGARVSTQGAVRYMNYGIADVSPDGIPVLLRPDGRLDAGPPDNQVFASGSIQVLPRGAFIALDAKYRPYGGNGAVAPVTLPGRIYGLRVHGDLCIYHAEQGARLILQRRDALVGVEVAAGLLECYRPDFEERDGQILVLYATKEGEAPGQLICVQTSRAAFAPLKSAPSPVPVPVPAPVPAPVPQPKPEPTPVSFEHRMPNCLNVVEAVKNAHPDEWANREDLRFSKRLGWTLYSTVDQRFGLLGKRMSDNLAADAVTFLNPTVDPQLPPEMSTEAADVIGSSHSSTPTAAWSPMTQPVREGGFGAKWIKPERPADEPATPPVEHPKTVEERLSAIEARLDALERK